MSKWYLIKVSHGQERKLNEQFNDKIALGKIKNIKRFICPLEEKVVNSGNKKVKKNSVIYNGYLYFETEKLLSDDELKTISLYPNVMSLMGSKLPILLSDSDIKRILKDDKLEEHIDIKLNKIKKDSKVKVTDGVFNGLVGVVNEILNDGIEVIITIFDKETKVILPLEKLIKI